MATAIAYNSIVSQERNMSTSQVERAQRFMRQALESVVTETGRERGAQAELARRMHVIPQAITRLLRDGMVGLGTVRALATYLGVSEADILFEEPPRHVDLDNELPIDERTVYPNLAVLTGTDWWKSQPRAVRDAVLSVRSAGGDRPVSAWAKITELKMEEHKLGLL